MSSARVDQPVPTRAARGFAIRLLVAGLALLPAGCWSDESPQPPAPEGPTPRSTTDPGGELRAPLMLQPFDIGGDFVLTDHQGAEFGLADHRGEVFLMFFGYTSCPDFCPRTLSLIARATERLGDQANAVTTLFVSVDPERDTPQKLAQYLEYFDIKAIGLTGSKEQIDLVVPMYAARYEAEPGTSDAALTFAHTTYIYLIDQQGRVRYTFMHNDTPEFIAAGIEQVLLEAPAS